MYSDKSLKSKRVDMINKPPNINISSVLIGLMSRVFTRGPEDQDSIPSRVIPKTKKIDATLLNTQHYKVRIKGKVEQSREWSSILPYTSM